MQESMQQIKEKSGGWWAMTIVSWLVTFVYLASGGTKLFAPEVFAAKFQAWGYPLWFMTVVGLVEVLGGLLLLAAATRLWGALILVVVMIGAAGTHMLAGEWVGTVAPVVLLALLVWITRRMAWEHQREDLAGGGEQIHASS